MSLCTRCGKPRIPVRTYTEKIGNSIITNIINECADPECQKIVASELRADEKKRGLIRKDQENREFFRNHNRGIKKHSLVL